MGIQLKAIIVSVRNFLLIIRLPLRPYAILRGAVVTLLLRRETGLMEIMVQEENKESSATSLSTAINYFQITNFAGI